MSIELKYEDFKKSTVNIFMNEPIKSYKLLVFVFNDLMSSFAKPVCEKWKASIQMFSMWNAV